MDSNAINYNPLATIENHTCLYNIDPIQVTINDGILLPNSLKESSGLFVHSNLLWTHNDNQESKLYSLSINNLQPIDSVDFGINMIDWEETQFLNGVYYLGDFGNNENGIRNDLRIFKVSPLNHTVDTIHFSYVNQPFPMVSNGSNQTDFDCEAFLVTDTVIYLFTKQWISNKTELHIIPNQAGTHVTSFMGTFDTEGMVTGATFYKDEIILIGYNTYLMPFLYRIKDFQNDDFLVSNKRKYTIPLAFHQVEAITYDSFVDSLYFTNEEFSMSGTVVTAKLFNFQLKDSLVDDALFSIDIENQLDWFLFDFKTSVLKTFHSSEPVTIFNQLGQVVFNGCLPEEGVSLIDWFPGIYFLKRVLTGDSARILLMN